VQAHLNQEPIFHNEAECYIGIRIAAMGLKDQIQPIMRAIKKTEGVTNVVVVGTEMIKVTIDTAGPAWRAAYRTYMKQFGMICSMYGSAFCKPVEDDGFVVDLDALKMDRSLLGKEFITKVCTSIRALNVVSGVVQYGTSNVIAIKLKPRTKQDEALASIRNIISHKVLSLSRERQLSSTAPTR